MKKINISLVLLMLFLTACGQATSNKNVQPKSVPTAAAAGEDTSVLDVPTTVATQLVIATSTETPPTETTVPATAIPNPMSIEAARLRTYPGSDIVIEKEFTAAANYHRYYASYLSDGLKIYGLLTIPDGPMPAGGWPAIVFNHGFIPPTMYRTTERYLAYVDWLARAGYVVYKIDYRGNDQSEGVATGAYGDPGYTDDVLNALSSLKRYPQVNPNKIGMWGHSMGGFLTLRAMVISKDIKVGVIWGGVVGSYSDMMYKWHVHNGPTPTPQPELQGEGHGWHAWINQYGTPAQNPQFWDSISATSYLADLSGPLQLHHGEADTEVPIAFSENLAQNVRAVGGTAEFYTYPGNDHNISQSFSLAMTRTIQFFDHYLK
ncbi:MAG: prolyl oligopeptidase family serine peptidase [Anaerolineaceae bacterium]|nr:prolyl oligopeptidase family serine peptidase [Anaerolineaceae bacterium]